MADEHDSDPIRTEGRSRGSLRSLIALLVAIGGVIGALTALVRAADESLPRESYKTLAQGITQVQAKCDQDHIQDHEEMVRMHAYLDGYLHAPTVIAPWPFASSTSSTSRPPTSASSAATSGTAKLPSAPIPSSTANFTASPAANFTASPAPAPWKAPDFDSLRKARGD